MKKTKQNYLYEALKYISSSKNYILFALFLMLLTFLIALLFQTHAFIENAIKQIISDLAEKTTNMNFFSLAVFIFSNNLKVSLIALFFGFFFGIVPIFLALSNGYVIGYVSKLVVNSEGVGSLWRLLPHGIFEIPAVLISLGLGMKLGFSFFNLKPDKVFLERIYLSIKSLIIIVLLLIIAAVIESGLIVFLS